MDALLYYWLSPFSEAASQGSSLEAFRKKWTDTISQTKVLRLKCVNDYLVIFLGVIGIVHAGLVATSVR